jgi:hypothetical protein
MQVPILNLSHGQVIRTLCVGKILTEPQLRLVRDQLRYLRQRGVPFNEGKRGQGRGHRIRYSYEELVELGVALYALRKGLRPQDVVNYLVTHRKYLRQRYREALEDQPEQALEADWLTNGGKVAELLSQGRFLRLHNRYSDTPGKYEMILPEDAQEFGDIFGMREVFADGTSQPLVPLTRIALELMYWVRKAPEIKPGRRTRGQQSPMVPA